MTQPPPKRRGLYPGNPLKLHFQPSHSLNFGKLFCVFAGSLSDSVQNDFFIRAYDTIILQCRRPARFLESLRVGRHAEDQGIDELIQGLSLLSYLSLSG